MCHIRHIALIHRCYMRVKSVRHIGLMVLESHKVAHASHKDGTQLYKIKVIIVCELRKLRMNCVIFIRPKILNSLKLNSRKNLSSIPNDIYMSTLRNDKKRTNYHA